MAIEQHEGGTLITGEHINLYHLMLLASALGLEINTGMKASGGRSTMATAAKVCGSKGKRKTVVLADLVAYIESKFPEYRPAPSVRKALGLPPT